jgi:hypothetical protein
VGRVIRWSAGAALLVAAACRRDPHSSGQGVYADIVARDIPIVEKSVGVPFKQPPKFEVKTRAQVRAFVTAQLEDSATLRDVAGKEAAYKVFGLIPDTMNVRNLFLNLLTEQIIGLYDPKTKVLYLMSGAPEDVVGPTIMHELVHALQDQYINLDSLLHAPLDDDQSLAMHAVIEGEATYEQMEATVRGGGNFAAHIPGGRDRIRDLIRDSQMSPVFSASPMVVQEETLFPYINGADFVWRYKSQFPGKLPFHDMPQSTEQVMHDRAYFAPKRDAPLRIGLPKLANRFYENTLGEFDTRLFLFAHLRDQEVAARASIGWGGDRYVVLRTPNGNGVAWVTVWDSGIDAAEFVDAFGRATQLRYGASAPTISETGVRSYSGRGRTVVVTPREIGGKNVVLVIDVPAGTSPNVLDLGRVTIGS